MEVAPEPAQLTFFGAGSGRKPERVSEKCSNIPLMGNKHQLCPRLLERDYNETVSWISLDGRKERDKATTHVVLQDTASLFTNMTPNIDPAVMAIKISYKY